MRHCLICVFCGLLSLTACQSPGGGIAASDPAKESGPAANITAEVKRPDVNPVAADPVREPEAEKGLIAFVDGNFKAADTLGNSRRSVSYRFKGEVHQDVVIQLSSAKGGVFEVIDDLGERIADDRTSFSFTLMSTGVHEIIVKQKGGSAGLSYALYVSRL